MWGFIGEKNEKDFLCINCCYWYILLYVNDVLGGDWEQSDCFGAAISSLCKYEYEYVNSV